MARGGNQKKPAAAPAKGGKQPAAAAAPVRTVALGAAVGIDFGSATVTLAAFKGGQFEAIVNTDGERYTPLIAGYANEVLLGASAKSVQIKNITNTVGNVLHFLAKPVDTLTDADKELLYAPYVALEDGTVGFQVELKGEQTIVSPAQIITQFSQQLLKYAQQYWDCAVTSAVLSIPYDFTQAQQIALIQAVEKAGFNVLGTVYDPLAAAVSFHLDQPNFNKINTYDNTPYSVQRVGTDNVLVVDVGQNSIKTSIISVQQGLLNTVGTVSEKGGSGEIDKVLFKHFCDKFYEENDTHLGESTRAVSRLKQAVEQVKRTIAQAPTAGVQLDGLYLGLDLFSDINRRNFDDLTEPFFAKFAQQLKDVFARYASTIKPEAISRIILAGGSATLPNFQRTITKFFNQQVGSCPAILKHVNICDTVAFGAAKLASTYALELDQYTLAHPSCESHKEIHANAILAASKPQIDTTTSSVGNSCVFQPYQHYTHLSLSKALYVKTFHGNFVTALPMTSAVGTTQYVTFTIPHPKRAFAQIPEGKTLTVQLYESSASIPEHVNETSAQLVASLPLSRADILAAATDADLHVTAVVKFELDTTVALTASVAYHTKGQQVPKWVTLFTASMLATEPLKSSQYGKVLQAPTLQQQEFDKKERCIARIQYIVAKYEQWRALPKHDKFITKNASFMANFVHQVEQFIAQHFNYIANVLPNPYSNKNLDKAPLVIAGDKQILDINTLDKLLHEFSVMLHDLLTFRKFTAKEAQMEIRARMQKNAKKGAALDDDDDLVIDMFDDEDEELLEEADAGLDDDDLDLDNDFGAMDLGDDDDDLDIDMDFGADLDMD